MLITEIFRVALEAIRANKLRSFLTMLGIIIGIAAVITMVALGEGAQRAVQARLQGLGVNVLTVRPGQEFFGGVDRGDAGSRPRTPGPCWQTRGPSRRSRPRCSAGSRSSTAPPTAT